MKILPYRLESTKHKFTSRTGLVIAAETLQRLGLSTAVDRQLPTVGSNHGYRHSAVFNTFLLMLSS